MTDQEGDPEIGDAWAVLDKSAIQAIFCPSPRTLTQDGLDRATRFLQGGGGWTSIPPSLIHAVREGATVGSQYPAEPFIHRLLDVKVEEVATEAEPQLVLYFSHTDFPGVRFGYHFTSPADELHGLQEEIETGAVHRFMKNAPIADSDGITWIDEIVPSRRWNVLPDAAKQAVIERARAGNEDTS